MVRAEPPAHPAHRRVPDLGRHPARPQRPGQHVRVHAVRVRGQVRDQLRRLREPLRLDRPGRADDGRAEQADLDRHRRPRPQVRRRRLTDRGRRERRVAAAVAEQRHHRRVLRRGKQLGRDLEAEHARLQPPLLGQVPGPARAGHVARHHEAEGGPVPRPRDREQPLRLLRRWRHAHDQVVRRPGVRVVHHRAPGEHGVEAPRGQLALEFRAAPFQLGQRLLKRAREHHAVRRDEVEALAESDERHPHPVRPPVRDELDGQGGEGGPDRVRGPAHRDQPVRHLQVHHDPAACRSSPGSPGPGRARARRPRRVTPRRRPAAATPARRRPAATGRAAPGRPAPPTGPGAPRRGAPRTRSAASCPRRQARRRAAAGWCRAVARSGRPRRGAAPPPPPRRRRPAPPAAARTRAATAAACGCRPSAASTPAASKLAADNS